MTIVQHQRRAFFVPSRTTADLTYRVDLAVDGTILCNCTGYAMRRDCWHARLIREEIKMNDIMSTALVPVMPKPITSLLPTEREYALIDRAAAMVFNGAISLPKELNTPQKVAAVMLYGLELGLGPMTAIRHLYIINGRVQPSCEVMAGLLLSRHPDARLSVEEISNERCVMRLVWPSRGVDDTYPVTWDDIKRAKLDQNEVAQKYPQDRLRYHCTKRLLRIYAPDVINGLDQAAPIIEEVDTGRYIPDEEGAVGELYNEGDHPAFVEGELVDLQTGEVIEPGAAQEEGDSTAGALQETSPAAPPTTLREHGARRPASATARGADVSIASSTPAAAPPAEPMVSEDQRRSIADWLDGIRGKHGVTSVGLTAAWLKEAFPYCLGETGRPSYNRLTAADAEHYIWLLRHIHASKAGAVPDVGDELEHDYAPIGDSAEIACSICGLKLGD